jgi:hypothetical protein
MVKNWVGKRHVIYLYLFFGTNFLFNQRRIEGEKYNIGMHRKKPTNIKKYYNLI